MSVTVTTCCGVTPCFTSTTTTSREPHGEVHTDTWWTCSNCGEVYDAADPGVGNGPPTLEIEAECVWCGATLTDASGADRDNGAWICGACRTRGRPAANAAAIAKIQFRQAWWKVESLRRADER